MADEEPLSVWPVEHIPQTDSLYKRVHRNLFKPDGTVMTGAFAHREMSVDWSKYSTPEQTRDRGGSSFDNAVLEMSVAEVRHIPGQSVEHAPIPPNRAHAHVVGNKTAQAKVLLRRTSSVVRAFQG